MNKQPEHDNSFEREKVQQTVIYMNINIVSESVQRKPSKLNVVLLSMYTVSVAQYYKKSVSHVC